MVLSLIFLREVKFWKGYFIIEYLIILNTGNNLYHWVIKMYTAIRYPLLIDHSLLIQYVRDN